MSRTGMPPTRADCGDDKYGGFAHVKRLRWLTGNA
jgi:hypothetical protein